MDVIYTPICEHQRTVKKMLGSIITYSWLEKMDRAARNWMHKNAIFIYRQFSALIHCTNTLKEEE